MTINALSASNSVLIPIQCEFFALEGLAQLLNTVKLVRKSINPSLSIKGFLPTMFSSQNNLSKQVFADLKQHFNGKLFKDEKDKYIVVPRNVKLAESPSFGKPAILYDVKSSGSIAYQNLAQTIIEVMKSKKLGRGLDALFGEIDESYENEGTQKDSVLEISLKDIKPNPFQPRKTFDEEALNELAESIKNDGLLQPIVVNEDIDGYILIAGERRLRA